MSSAPVSDQVVDQASALPWRHRVLILLLFVEFIWIGILFPAHAFSLPSAWGTRLFAIVLAALALLTLHALWRRKDWAAWSTLAVVSGALTIDLYAWSTNVTRLWPLVDAALAAAMIVLAFGIGEPASRTVTRRQRIFFAIIVAFPAWVAVGGWSLPGRIDEFLPFRVPPLHARFIGAMYLAGATMMLLATLARAWHEVRVVTVILSLWTGLLGIVSFLHLEVFDWSWRPTWFWWVAYIWFPIGAAFIAWNQRDANDHPDTPALSPTLRGFLAVQGAVAVVLALRPAVRPKPPCQAVALGHHAAVGADLQRAISRLRGRQPLYVAPARLGRGADSRAGDPGADVDRDHWIDPASWAVRRREPVELGLVRRPRARRPRARRVRRRSAPTHYLKGLPCHR
jgi:hypothetical protein